MTGGAGGAGRSGGCEDSACQGSSPAEAVYCRATSDTFAWYSSLRKVAGFALVKINDRCKVKFNWCALPCKVKFSCFALFSRTKAWFPSLVLLCSCNGGHYGISDSCCRWWRWQRRFQLIARSYTCFLFFSSLAYFQVSIFCYLPFLMTHYSTTHRQLLSKLMGKMVQCSKVRYTLHMAGGAGGAGRSGSGEDRACQGSVPQHLFFALPHLALAFFSEFWKVASFSVLKYNMEM